MRKSKYGKELAFFWEGLARLGNVELVPERSTLSYTREEEEQISAKAEELDAHPTNYNGQLWGYRGNREKSGLLYVAVSETTYAHHLVLREKERPIKEYPKPLGPLAGQETYDGYFPLGVQRGELVLLGAGFTERDEDGTSLEATLRRETKQETNYGGNNFYEDPEFFRENAKVMAIVFGSRHDTGIAVHVPIPVPSREVSLGDDEHTDLLFLPNSPATLTQVMTERSYKGLPATDQLIGFLEGYNSLKEAGRLVSAYQHQ